MPEKSYPYCLQRARVQNGSLIFDEGQSADRSLRDGFFLVAIPEDIKLDAGDTFAQNFYLPHCSDAGPLNEYRGFDGITAKLIGCEHEGYYQRDIDQTEQFFLERRFWDKYYPPALVDLAEKMNDLATTIVKGILTYVGIPTALWAQATGGCVENCGAHHLTFNHFRPLQMPRGLNVHKDSGWVTILRSLEPGLEAFIDGVWRAITPIEGYFIVNFGCAMEILTKHTTKPVAAVTHRVVKQFTANRDRFSYALFTDNSLSEDVSLGLYSYSREGLTFEQSFKCFLDEILRKTYNEDTVGLY